MRGTPREWEGKIDKNLSFTLSSTVLSGPLLRTSSWGWEQRAALSLSFIHSFMHSVFLFFFFLDSSCNLQTILTHARLLNLDNFPPLSRAYQSTQSVCPYRLAWVARRARRRERKNGKMWWMWALDFESEWKMRRVCKKTAGTCFSLPFDPVRPDLKGGKRKDKEHFARTQSLIVCTGKGAFEKLLLKGLFMLFGGNDVRKHAISPS